MSDADFQRASELFLEVCDLGASERERVLDDRCAGDSALRAEVERLLSLDQGEDDGFELSRGAGIDLLVKGLATDEPMSPPDRIGHYRIVREINRGGMGIVYEAEQEDPRRRVALKVVRQELATPSLARRFRYEAQTLGRLDHPGIAYVHEAGIMRSDGETRPFFAMEYIDGKPIDVHVRERALGLAERLELVARVCDAVQHAHQKGVIHRDLKPANILVKQSSSSVDNASTDSLTSSDSIGQPKVLDFGVARVTRGTGADLDVTTIQTRTGQMIGTLAYMSPEQVDGSLDIDARTDVYALGVILYELASGKRPHDLTGKPVVEAARIIRDEEATSLSLVSPALRGDVATIVGKAMSKDRSRRYSSAAELGNDIRRYLRDEPIMARAPSVRYQLTKFARRNRALVGGVAATLVVAIIATILASVFAVASANRERLALRGTYSASINAARSAFELGNVNALRTSLDRAPIELRGWEWHHLHRSSQPIMTQTDIGELGSSPYPIQPAFNSRCAFTPDGTPLGAVLRDASIELIDLRDGSFVAAVNASQVQAMALAPDGSRVAWVTPQDSGHILRTWNVFDGTPGGSASVAGGRALLRFSADARLLIVGDDDGARVLDCESASLRQIFHRTDILVLNADITPDGTRLVLLHGTRKHTPLPSWKLFLYDVPTGKLLAAREQETHWVANALAIRQDGSLIAISKSNDRMIEILDGISLERQQRLINPDLDQKSSLTWTTDGEYMIATTPVTLHVWETRAWDEIRTLDAPTGSDVTSGAATPPYGAVLSPDNKQLAMSGLSSAYLLDIDLGASMVLEGHGTYVYYAAFTPDGGTIVSVGFGGDCRFWDAWTGRPLGVLRLPWYANGNLALAFDQSASEIMISHTPWTWSVATRTWTSYDDPSREVSRRLAGHATSLDRFAGGSDWHARIGRGPEGARSVELTDLSAGRTTRFTSPTAVDLQPAPDRSWVAVGGTFQIRDLPSGRLRATPEWPAGSYGLDANPDGSRIALAANDGTIPIWDASTFELLTVLRAHRNYVHDVHFSPDGTRLVSASGDGTIRVWDSVDRETRTREAKERAEVRERLLPALQPFLMTSSADRLERMERELALNDDELSIARQVVLESALRDPAPVPPARSMPTDGTRMIARYDASKHSTAVDPSADAIRGWQMYPVMVAARTGQSPDGKAWRIECDPEGFDFGWMNIGSWVRYVVPLAPDAVEGAESNGWRLAARVKRTAGDTRIGLRYLANGRECSYVLIDPKPGGDSEPRTLEMRFDPVSDTARVSVDGRSVEGVRTPLTVTRVAELQDQETPFVRGDHADAVAIELVGETSATIDILSLEFEILGGDD